MRTPGGKTGVSPTESRDRGRGVSCLVGMIGVLPVGRGGMGEEWSWGCIGAPALDGDGRSTLVPWLCGVPTG